MPGDGLIHLTYPFKRTTYPGIDNPEYVGDIRILTEGIMSSLAMMCGLGPNDFAIISGLDYITDAPPPYYAPGYFYLNGIFYQMGATFLENNWLVPNVQNALQANFDDGNTRPIYQYFGAISLPADPVNGGPKFVGNMNQYRLGNKYLATQVASMLATIATLGDSSTKDVGTTAGTVAAGDDPRLVYTQAQLDARYAQRINVIERNLVAAPPGPAYVPINPWDPINKAYSDANSGRRLYSGTVNLGDADTAGGTLHTIAFGATIPEAAYLLLFSSGSLSANHNIDIFSNVCWCNKAETSFGVWYRETQAGVQNVQLDWIIFAP